MNIRRILFLLASLALLAHGMLPAQSDWTWQNPRPQGNNLECVDPVTANLVFASGGAGMRALQDHFGDARLGDLPRRVLVAGSSAGGYGAMINMPWLVERRFQR